MFLAFTVCLSLFEPGRDGTCSTHTHTDKHAMGLSCLLVHTKNPVLVVSMRHLGRSFVDRICGTSFSETQARAPAELVPFGWQKIALTDLTAVFLSERPLLRSHGAGLGQLFLFVSLSSSVSSTTMD